MQFFGLFGGLVVRKLCDLLISLMVVGWLGKCGIR
jgi:hypothetical protein